MVRWKMDRVGADTMYRCFCHRAKGFVKWKMVRDFVLLMNFFSFGRERFIRFERFGTIFYIKNVRSQSKINVVISRRCKKYILI